MLNSFCVKGLYGITSAVGTLLDQSDWTVWTCLEVTVFIYFSDWCSLIQIITTVLSLFFGRTEQWALSAQSFATVFKLLVFYSEAPFVNQKFCIPAQLCQAT